VEHQGAHTPTLQRFRQHNPPTPLRLRLKIPTGRWKRATVAIQRVAEVHAQIYVVKDWLRYVSASGRSAAASTLCLMHQQCRRSYLRCRSWSLRQRSQGRGRVPKREVVALSSPPHSDAPSWESVAIGRNEDEGGVNISVALVPPFTSVVPKRTAVVWTDDTWAGSRRKIR